ncbi:MAG: aminotransferase class V-fold PLP-dependent enzyme [Clostridia bacterium]|jgi:dTDP-4-amino-4,6-dideoxygalactose transaminase|nr:aminotransferase class V-fold PLP-dependent enzyme [Clostridia bacterium]
MYRIGKEEIDAVARVIESGELFKINGGPLQESKNLDREMKELFGADAIVMTSGHAALTAALIGMGIGPGDQVVVPAYTYIATAMAVVAAGAIPVIADVDESLTLSPRAFEKAITKHTRAVIPVHIQGFPCKMNEICEIAGKHNILVLEDACQADGGSYNGKRLGTIGDAGAFSFNFYKVISCGEGGALLTNNRTIYERALIYHDASAVCFFGDQLKDVDEKLFCGSEYRTNEISSAILRVQLTRLDGILADLRKNKKLLMEKIAPYCDFVPSNDIEGDCGTTVALCFDSAEKADSFTKAEGINAISPINTGKHIYTNWTQIMSKTGAVNPLMDPFKMEANKAIVPDYNNDMCTKTLELLAKAVYISVNPDWSEKDVEEEAEKIIAALK